MNYLKDAAGQNVHKFVYSKGNVGLTGTFPVGQKAALKAHGGPVTFTITWEDATATTGVILLDGDEVMIDGASSITITSINGATLSKM